MRGSFRSIGFVMLMLLIAAPAMAPVHAGPMLYTASDAIGAAVRQRLGIDADVTVLSIDVKGETPVFREARPDPAARLGKPMRFTLYSGTNDSLPVNATLSIVVPHAVIKADVTRGQALTAADYEIVRTELSGTPLVRMPAPESVTGARTLRPMTPGTIVLASFLALRRAIEAGDSITVVALNGAIEVTAKFVAADPGDVGDTIRVKNPESKKFLRGRVVKPGLVEVMYER